MVHHNKKEESDALKTGKRIKGDIYPFLTKSGVSVKKFCRKVFVDKDLGKLVYEAFTSENPQAIERLSDREDEIIMAVLEYNQHLDRTGNDFARPNKNQTEEGEQTQDEAITVPTQGQDKEGEPQEIMATTQHDIMLPDRVAQGAVMQDTVSVEDVAVAQGPLQPMTDDTMADTAFSEPQTYSEAEIRSSLCVKIREHFEAGVEKGLWPRLYAPFARLIGAGDTLIKKIIVELDSYGTSVERLNFFETTARAILESGRIPDKTTQDQSENERLKKFGKRSRTTFNGKQDVLREFQAIYELGRGTEWENPAQYARKIGLANPSSGTNFIRGRCISLENLQQGVEQAKRLFPEFAQKLITGNAASQTHDMLFGTPTDGKEPVVDETPPQPEAKVNKKQVHIYKTTQEKQTYATRLKELMDKGMSLGVWPSKTAFARATGANEKSLSRILEGYEASVESLQRFIKFAEVAIVQ